MKNEEECSGSYVHSGGRGKQQSLVVRISDIDFQRDVLEKLAHLETKMDMLMGGGQPGRMKDAENRLVELEKNDIKRGVYDRLLNAAIAIAISVVVSMHERWGIK